MAIALSGYQTRYDMNYLVLIFKTTHINIFHTTTMFEHKNMNLRKMQSRLQGLHDVEIYSLDYDFERTLAFV